MTFLLKVNKKNNLLSLLLEHLLEYLKMKQCVAWSRKSYKDDKEDSW